MLNINHVLRNFYKKYPETVEISLESIGESPTTTKPTILVICTSVNKVRGILKRSLVYDRAIYGLKVCRGKVVRSRKYPRSMAGELGSPKGANSDHQQRPCNGASIGAYVGDRHLPPVSFGGLIVVDGKPYGMTVHHMLDDLADSEDSETEEPTAPVLRSSAHQLNIPGLTRSGSSAYSSSDEECRYTVSDYESDFTWEEDSDAEFSDSYEDESEDEGDDDDEIMEPGDIKGIPQGCGEGYIITQPAIDDVPDDFFPSDDTRDEDHLDSFQLGQVYASSGIRRRTDPNGTVHEIDWALFEFSPDRLPTTNIIQQSGERLQAPKHRPSASFLSVAPSQELGGLEVHGTGRSSGLQSGRILPAMVSVKMFGRQSSASSWQVAGRLGIPGDSGAWVIDSERGRACGHVLAWSARKRVAYICPMDVLVRDMGETLGATSIRLPGSEELYAAASVLASTVACESIQQRPETPLVDDEEREKEIQIQIMDVDENETQNAEDEINERGTERGGDEMALLLEELRRPPTPEEMDSLELNLGLGPAPLSRDIERAAFFPGGGDGCCHDKVAAERKGAGRGRCDGTVDSSVLPNLKR